MTLLAGDLSTVTSLLPSGSSGITNAVMTKEVQGDNFNPVGITDSFPPNQGKFHAVVSIEKAPPNSKVKAWWYAQDVIDGSGCNVQITNPTELTVSDTRNLDFTLKPQTSWLPGLYHVYIYVNDALNNDVDFRVQ